MTVRQTLEAGSPFDIYRSALTKKYADFTGRARRAEYWWFVLVNFGVAIVISVFALILILSDDSLWFLYSYISLRLTPSSGCLCKSNKSSSASGLPRLVPKR